MDVNADFKLSYVAFEDYPESIISNGGVVSTRAIVLQQKTGRPVQFEITELTYDPVSDWMVCANISRSGYLFPTKLSAS